MPFLESPTQALPPVELSTEHPAVVDAVSPVELWELGRNRFGGFESSSATRSFEQRFRGRVAMVTTPDTLGHPTLRGDRLIVVGRVHDNIDEIGVFRADVGRLQQIGHIAADVAEVSVVIDVVRLREVWHLFGCALDGRTTHHVSADLVSWERRPEIERSFPAFGVSGVAVVGDHLLLAGRVVIDGATYGWGLLASNGEAFVARPVPVPLSSQLSVVGPVANSDGDVVLLLDSGTEHTVARSTGRGWRLDILTPSLVPTVVFMVDNEAWMAGHLPGTDEAGVALVGGERLDGAGPSSLGLIRAAVSVNGQLVLGRDCR
jgi:hypothetical protein